MMDTQDENVLRTALPPATDYLTYLTLLEYNLTAETLPLLDELLQDANLTANIGWDLVEILLPLLPASEQALHTVARLGNPREVILKVTQALRFLDFEDEDQASEAGTSSENGHAELAHDSTAGQSPQASVLAPTGQTLGGRNRLGMTEPSIKVGQFRTLLSMLSTLHPRVRTNHPSRFLATSLQAVLASASKAENEIELLMDAMLTFVESAFSPEIPHLPPRLPERSSAELRTDTILSSDELELQTSADKDSDVSKRLLQSFLTYSIGLFVQSIPNNELGAGLALSARLFERHNSAQLPPAKRFANSRHFATRSSQHHLNILAKANSIALQLNLGPSVLAAAAIYRSAEPEVNDSNDEEPPPENVEDIPLSNEGAVVLLGARLIFATAGPDNSETALPIFPTIAAILDAEQIAGTSSGHGVNSQPALPVTDAIVAVSIRALDVGCVGAPSTSAVFTAYMRNMCEIAATAFSEALRFFAHFVLSSVLKAHRNGAERFEFIQNMLKDPPYENLRTAAVGWLKAEVLQLASSNGNTESERTLIDAATLHIFSRWLFPDVSKEMNPDEVSQNWVIFVSKMSFYLASLNLLYLLLSNSSLRAALEVDNLDASLKIRERFVVSLKTYHALFEAALEEDRLVLDSADDTQAALLDLQLVDDTLNRVAERFHGTK